MIDDARQSWLLLYAIWIGILSGHVYVTQAFIYLFQIKEYRFDRFFSQLREEGAGFVINSLGRRGALTKRNILIASIAFIIFLALISFSYILLILALFSLGPPGGCETPWICASNSQYAIAPIVVSMAAVLILAAYCFVLSFIATLCGVLLTWPFAYLVRRSLVERAKMRIANHPVEAIVISGTYGKSSVKEFLHEMISMKYQVGKTEKNMNTGVGVALSILKNLRDDTEYFVGEVGGYKRGEVAQAAAVLGHHTKVGIITSFGNQHLSLYKSRSNLIHTESEILDVLTSSSSTLYIHLDACQEPVFQNEIQTRAMCRLITYSASQPADIQAHKITTTHHGSQATVTYASRSLHIQTRLLGAHSIENLLPVIGWCIDHGYTNRQIIDGAAAIDPIDAKLSIHKGIGGSTILNDSSNSSSNGFLSAIKTLELFPQTYKVVIGSGIIELGSEKEAVYREITQALNDVSIAYITHDRLFKKFDTKDLIYIVNKEQTIMSILAEYDLKDTVILLEGRQPKKRLQSIIIGDK